MTRRLSFTALCIGLVVLIPASGGTQISFPKTAYYVALGDSVAAGQGAVPMTNGYAHQLYEHGVFGSMTDTYFVDAAVKGARSWELRDHQVPQVLCSVSAMRPTVVTITAGANDFFTGDNDISGIAQRVAEAVNILLNNGTPYVGDPARDPADNSVCPPLANVTILVSNYFHIPHPDEDALALLEKVLYAFDLYLRAALKNVVVPAGSKLAVVDLFSTSAGRQGLVLIERRLGYEGLLAFDPHPTNLGHTFIAAQFEATWKSLQ